MYGVAEAAASSTSPLVILKAALAALVLTYVGTNLVVAVRRTIFSPSVRERTFFIVQGLRPRHFLLAPFAFALVVVVGFLLMQVPGLDFGWWTLLGGEGNPVFGTTDATAGTPLEWLIPTIFVLLLVPSLPLFAEREERMFRLGAEGWSRTKRLRRSVEFGLVHAVIGIPIGLALALSVGGLYLLRSYLSGYRRAGREEGLVESTRAHLAYNLLIVVIVLPVVILGAAQS